MKGKFFVLLCVVVYPVGIEAQNIVFTANCDRTQVEVGETFTLEVTVSGDISHVPTPELPPMDNFDVVSTSRRQSVSIVNMKASSEVSFIYILSPQKEGKFTIGSCTMKYGNQTFNTEPIEIEVVKSTTTTVPPSHMPAGPKTTQPLPREKASKKALFATLMVNKSTAYVNEEVILIFRFYQGVNLLSTPRYTPPAVTGFWKEELGQSSEYKIIEGRRYLVTEIKYAMFPTQAGEFTLSGAEITCQVEENIFDNFFSFSFGGRTEVVKANPVKLKVISFPSTNKPANFTGVVGQFRISAKFDTHEVRQQEPATLSITIAGTGNIKSVEAPELPNLPNFKVYQSGSKMNLDPTKDRVSGSKTFSVLLVPEREGKFEIPGISFTYFDPTIKEYKTITSVPQNLTVLAGSKVSTYVPGYKQPIEILGKDIRYIKTKVRLANETNYIHCNYLFLVIQFIPILVLLISIRYARQKERLLKDKAYARAVKADKFVKRGLIQCSKFLAKGETKEFYNEVYKILTEYIGGKLNISGAALTLDVAISSLKDRAVNKETISKLHTLFSTCDLAKFGLGNLGVQEMKASYEELTNLLSELSKRL